MDLYYSLTRKILKESGPAVSFSVKSQSLLPDDSRQAPVMVFPLRYQKKGQFEACAASIE